MNILFISASFPEMMDGIGDSAAYLYDELSKRDKAVLLTSNKKEIKEYIKKNFNNKVYYLDRWNISKSNLKNILNIINTEQIDVVHIEYPGKGYGTDLLINILPLYLKLKNKNVKVFMRYHEFINSRLLRKIVDIPLLAFVKKIFVPSFLDYTTLQKIVKNKVLKTYLGASVPVKDKDRRKDRRKDEFVLGYFGFVYKGKGIEKLLEVMKSVIEKDNTIKLKMICDLKEDDEYNVKIKNMIKSYNLQSNVIVTGYVDVKDLSQTFSTVDAATLFFDDGLTLRRSSIINFIFEGIPIITSTGDIECNQIFDKNKDMFMSDDKNEIVNYILELRNDVGKYNLRCEEILKLRKYFDWEKITDDIYKEYLKV